MQFSLRSIKKFCGGYVVEIKLWRLIWDLCVFWLAAVPFYTQVRIKNSNLLSSSFRIDQFSNKGEITCLDMRPFILFIVIEIMFAWIRNNGVELWQFCASCLFQFRNHILLKFKKVWLFSTIQTPMGGWSRIKERSMNVNRHSYTHGL